jgi:hypothetical protein
MDLLERFPRAWCRTCEKVQPIILDVMKANDKNDHSPERLRVVRL